MAEDRSGEIRIVTQEEFRKRRRAKNRKVFMKRALLILACAAILFALVLAVVLTVKLIRRGTRGGERSALYNCTAAELVGVNESTLVHYTGDLVFMVSGGRVKCLSAEGKPMWEEDFGQGEPRVLPLSDSLAVYEQGGRKLCFYGARGLIWQKNFEADLADVIINESSQTVAVNLLPEDGHSKIIVFSAEKDGAKVDVPLMEKKFTTNYAVSVALSGNGKSIAVGELAEVDATGATKVSVMDVATGKSYFSKIFDGEICPYLGFIGSDRLAVAGARAVYLIENVRNTSSASSATKTVVSMGDASSRVLSVAAAGNYLLVATGGDGKSTVRVTDPKEGTEKTFTIADPVKQFLPAGKNVFALATENGLSLYDFDTNLVGNCEEKLDIQKILGNGKGAFAIGGGYGTMVALFTEKK